MATIKLRYVGDGAWLPMVPAADHEVEDEERAEELVASGLYERVTESKTRTRKASADSEE